MPAMSGIFYFSFCEAEQREDFFSSSQVLLNVIDNRIWPVIYDNCSHSDDKFKFGQIIFTSLAKEKQNTSKPTELQKRILELERQLEDEKLRSEAYARMIERAEKELKISIRKKIGTK